jgi:hypothetical protein
MILRHSRMIASASRAIDPPNLKSSADSEIFLPAGRAGASSPASPALSRRESPLRGRASNPTLSLQIARAVEPSGTPFGHHVSSVTEPRGGVTVVSRRRSLPRSAGGDRDSGCKLEDHVGPPAPVTSRPGGPGLAGSEPST